VILLKQRLFNFDAREGERERERGREGERERDKERDREKERGREHVMNIEKESERRTIIR
jgi:hypothetical protein